MSIAQGTLHVVADVSTGPDAASLVRAMPPRIQVHDGEFKMVGKGFGSLKGKFNPGLYLVRVEVGDKPYEQVVRVPSNGTANVSYPANPDPRSSSAAVVEGTSSLHEYTSEYTRVLSRTKAKLILGVGARLVVLASRQQSETAAEIRFNGVRLLDGTGKCIADLSRRSSVGGLTDDTLAKGFAAEVNPGPLVLEWKHETMNSYWRQPLWIPQGYVMLVFVTVRPGQTAPDMGSASIHLASLSAGFEPRDAYAAAAEVALESLRTGRQLLSETRLSELLRGKFQNPMLGIYGGHMILQRSLPTAEKVKILDEVLTSLQSLVPDSPDLAALRLMRSELESTMAPAQMIPCSWPPMIRLGYLAFRNADWDRPGLFIKEGSVADRVRTTFGVAGVWSTWATDRNKKAEYPGAHSADPMEFVIGQVSGTVKAFLGNVVEDTDPLDDLVIETQRSVPKFKLSHFGGAGFRGGTADAKKTAGDVAALKIAIPKSKPAPPAVESLAWTGLNKKQAQDVANHLL